MRLNVGAGTHPVPGYINIDKFVPLNCSDVMFGDIEEGIEFDDNSFDEILLDNVIEHLNDIPRVMREIRRLLGPGGICKIITPHFTSSNSWVDPTHRFHLSYFSLDFFANGSRDNYMDSKFRTLKKKLSFPGGLFGIFGRLIFRCSPESWERSWCFVLYV